MVRRHSKLHAVLGTSKCTWLLLAPEAAISRRELIAAKLPRIDYQEPAMLFPAKPLLGKATLPRRAVVATGRCTINLLLLLVAFTASARAEQVGEVDTAFKLLGPNHKIVMEAYDEPGVAGVTCYVSRAKTGGITGGLGLAEDKAEASIACRQVGPISFAHPLPLRHEVFNERMSILFKRLRIVRVVDAKRNTLVYLTYSDRLIEGSPMNSITAVPIDRSIAIPVKR
jgi:CreA protein